MPKKLTTESFIEKSKKLHGEKYDYSKVVYVNNHTPVIIICPEHGEFKQLPMVHLRGCDCNLCGNEKIKNKLKKEKPIIILDKEKVLEEKRKKLLKNFIEKARKIHGDKYDYSKVNYINNSTKVCIIDEYGEEFWQMPSNHLKSQGTPKNRYDLIRKKLALTSEEFIERARKIHGDKYDYSKVNYINNHTKVVLICSEHGEFLISPDKHLSGRGCVKCSYVIRGKKQSLGKEEFVKRAKEIHGDKYEYSNVEYKNNITKVCIICPKHGEFWQPPQVHLNGCGCNLCHCNKMETLLLNFFEEKKLHYEYQKQFEWLKDKKPLKLDFYLPDFNVAVECQGEQHFYPVKHFGGEKKLIKNIKRDKLKKELCDMHGIKILYFSNLKIDDKDIIRDLDKLMEEIVKNKSEKNK